MKSVSIVCALAALLAAPVVAVAQPAAAIGHPLGDASLRDGTLVVRVIDGDASKPVTGADVTVTLARADGQGTPSTLAARTDAEGRATFAEIEMGLMVQAATAAVDGGVTTSDLFPMPQTGGMRVMLSRLKVAVDGAAASTRGGAPMSPRTMSGQARPESNDPRDRITVRVSYNDFGDASDLSGQPVTLVGYRADLAVSAQTVNTDASGRAVFDGLDARGTTSYFAMTLLPRGGAFDRLITFPMFLTGEGGLRVMLSGEKRDADLPPVDDLSKLDEQSKAPLAAGVVRVQLAGVPEPGTPVELIDARTGAVVAQAPVGAPLPVLDTITATASAPLEDPALAPGALIVTVTDGSAPLPGIAVSLAKTGTEAVPPAVVTDAAGQASLVGLPTGEIVLALDLDQDATTWVKLQRPAAGARVTLTVTAQARGEGGARLTGVADGPDHSYYARTKMRDQFYLSAPFQLKPGRGAAITVLVMPRIMFQFSLTSWLDDVYVGVRGTFSIRNASWAPYQPGTLDKPDELVIPLPAKFTGAIVRDDFQQEVGVDPSRGFIIRRPLPPGGYQFVGAFSLKVHDGEVNWSMPLPLGAFESGLEFHHAGNSRLVLPAEVRGIKVQDIDDQRGRFGVLSPITILPKQSMQFTIRDLPREASWRTWGRRAAGAAVLLILALSTTLALWRPRRDLPTARFDALLDELAALDAAGGDPGRRAKLLDELETLARARGRAS